VVLLRETKYPVLGKRFLLFKGGTSANNALRPGCLLVPRSEVHAGGAQKGEWSGMQIKGMMKGMGKGKVMGMVAGVVQKLKPQASTPGSNLGWR